MNTKSKLLKSEYSSRVFNLLKIKNAQQVYDELIGEVVLLFGRYDSGTIVNNQLAVVTKCEFSSSDAVTFHLIDHETFNYINNGMIWLTDENTNGMEDYEIYDEYEHDGIPPCDWSLEVIHLEMDAEDDYDYISEIMKFNSINEDDLHIKYKNLIKTIPQSSLEFDICEGIIKFIKDFISGRE